jgi:hypothetical protein
MATYTFDHLDDLGLRGRVFYEMFPGTAASDAWRASFAAAHPLHAVSDLSGRGQKDDRDLDEILDETFPASDPPGEYRRDGHSRWRDARKSDHMPMKIGPRPDHGFDEPVKRLALAPESTGRLRPSAISALLVKRMGRCV